MNGHHVGVLVLLVFALGLSALLYIAVCKMVQTPPADEEEEAVSTDEMSREEPEEEVGE